MFLATRAAVITPSRLVGGRPRPHRALAAPDIAGGDPRTASIGTTWAPSGLGFIQSFAVDKRLTIADLRYERADIIIGSVLTALFAV